MSDRFWIPCDCGEQHPVSVSMAGSLLACSCGRQVHVPRLTELQKLRPEFQLKQQFDNPAYWDEHGCFLCRGPDGEQVFLILRCTAPEYVTVKAEVHPASFFSLLLYPIFGIFGAFVRPKEKVKINDGIVVQVSTEICETCRQQRYLEEKCMGALHEHELGAVVLETYPNTTLRVVTEPPIRRSYPF